MVDYTERAQEALDGMPDCLRLYLEKAGADDKDFPIIRAWLTAALSAVASEHQAALLARLREPEMQEAVRAAVLAEYVRAMAVVEAAREWAIDIRDNNRWLDDPRAIRVYNAVVGFAGLAALDAASAAGDAVTTEEDKQNHGDNDRC